MAEVDKEAIQVLVVEDDSDICDMLCLGLASAGYKVVKASDGRDAMRNLKRHSDISLIVSDIRMPEMSGVELLEFCKKNRPEIPVILISGDPRFLTAGHYLSEVVTVHPKPLSLEKLLQSIDSTLRKAAESPMIKTSA